MGFSFSDLIAGLRAGVFIKSVQRGTISLTGTTLTGTATITAINTSRYILIPLSPSCFGTGLGVGVGPSFSGDTFQIATYSWDIDLTNATTVTFTRGPPGGIGLAMSAKFQIVEFY